MSQNLFLCCFFKYLFTSEHKQIQKPYHYTVTRISVLQLLFLLTETTTIPGVAHPQERGQQMPIIIFTGGAQQHVGV